MHFSMYCHDGRVALSATITPVSSADERRDGRLGSETTTSPHLVARTTPQLVNSAAPHQSPLRQHVDTARQLLDIIRVMGGERDRRLLRQSRYRVPK